MRIKNESWWIWPLAGLLLLEAGYICFVLLDYYFSWMNTENFEAHAWIFEDSKNFIPQDFYKVMNVTILEGDPNRITRPIADFLRVFDAKFRTLCWNIIPPHPSLSVLWPLHLIGIPLCLYKFFRNMGCACPVAFAGVGLYASSIGFLCPVAMFFHQGKGMVNILTVAALFFGSLIYAHAPAGLLRISVWDIPRFVFYFASLLFCAFLAFFCDETGVFVPVICGFMFFPLLLRVKEWPLLVGGWLLIYAGYVLVIRFVLPYAHFLVWGTHIDLLHSRFLPNLTDIHFANFFTILSWLLRDYPHVQLNIRELFSNNPLLFSLQAVYTAAMLAVAGFFVRIHGSFSIERRAQIKRACILLCVFIVFDFLLLSKFVVTWGVWYYAALYPLLYYIVLVFLLQGAWESRAGTFLRQAFVLFVLIAIVHGLVFSTYRLTIFDYKKPENETYVKQDVFEGRIGKYYKTFSIIDGIKKSDCRRLYIVLIWAKFKNKDLRPIPQQKLDYCRDVLERDPSFLSESRYVGVEL